MIEYFLLFQTNNQCFPIQSYLTFHKLLQIFVIVSINYFTGSNRIKPISPDSIEMIELSWIILQN